MSELVFAAGYVLLYILLSLSLYIYTCIQIKLDATYLLVSPYLPSQDQTRELSALEASASELAACVLKEAQAKMCIRIVGHEGG